MNGLNKAAGETMFLKISGMTCAACASRVERGLAKLAGVEQVNVNFAAEKASITFDRAEISLGDIARKIEDLGYQVIKDKVDLKITGMTCAACSGRVERGLNKLPGVAGAVVNLAVERATVEFFPGTISINEIKAKIENLGYGAHDLTDTTGVDKEKRARQAEVRKQRFRLLFS
ncbi:MAG: copper ion binding protein, partial [Sporomusa sp.]